MIELVACVSSLTRYVCDELLLRSDLNFDRFGSDDDRN